MTIARLIALILLLVSSQAMAQAIIPPGGGGSGGSGTVGNGTPSQSAVYNGANSVVGTPLQTYTTTVNNNAQTIVNPSGLTVPTLPNGTGVAILGNTGFASRGIAIGSGIPGMYTTARIPADQSAITSGTQLGSFNAGGWNGTNLVTGVAAIKPVAAETWTSTTNGTSLSFDVTPVGTNALKTGVVTIDSNGQLNAFNGLSLPTLPANGIILAQGTNAVTALAPGASGLPLVSTGTASAPAYGALNLANTTGSFTNTLNATAGINTTNLTLSGIGTAGGFAYVGTNGAVSSRILGTAPNTITYSAYGDSNTAVSPYIGGAYPATFVDYLRSYLNVTPQNNAIGGQMSCDSTDDAFHYPLPSTSVYAVYSYMDGINDANVGGTGAYEVNFNNCETAGISWLAMPVANKVLASSSTRTGTWTTSTSGYVGTPLVSTTNGSTETYSVTSAGKPIIGWFRNKDGDGGTFTVAIDGGSSTTYSTATTTPIATRNGGTVGVSPIVFTGISAGTHSIVVTVTSATSASNSVEVVGFGSAPTGTPSQNILVAVGGVIRQQNDANSALSAQYNSDAQSNASTVASYGLPVSFVDVRSYVNSTTDMVNQYHPNSTGILHYYQAFQSVMLNLPISVLPQEHLTVSPTTDVTSFGTGPGALSGSRLGGTYANTAAGFEALGSARSVGSIQNSAFGYQALFTMGGGFGNTASGYQAAAFVGSGNYNSFFGALAGGGATVLANVSNNTGVGYQALNVTANGNNTGIGYKALLATTTGANNTGLGAVACGTLTTGAGNLCLGNGVGASTLTTGSYNILIGGSITTPAAGTNNYGSIGNVLFMTGIGTSANATPSATGMVGIGTNAPSAPLTVVGSPSGTVKTYTAAQTLTLTSDRYVVCDATSAAVTITLPAVGTMYNAANNTSSDFSIAKIDSSANACTITCNGGNWSTTGTTTTSLSNKGNAVNVFSNGTTCVAH